MKIKRKQIMLPMIAMIITVMITMLSGCGNNTPTTSGPTPISPTPTPGISTTGLVNIASIAQILNTTTTGNIIAFASTTGTITFAATTPQIQTMKTGDVLVTGITPATPEGLLAKVVTITNNPGGQVTVTTASAALADVIQSGSFSVSGTLNPNMIQTGVPLAFSSAINPLAIGKNFIVSINKITSIGTLTGSIGITPTFTLDASFANNKLSTLNLSTNNNIGSTISIFTGIAPNIKKEIPIYKLTCLPVAIYVPTPLGIPLPIIIKPVLTITVGLDGNAAIGTSFETSYAGNINAGLLYNQGVITPSYGSSGQYSVNSLPGIAMTNTAIAKLYTGAVLDFPIYGVGGLSATSEAYSQLAYNPAIGPKWKLNGGYSADLIANLSIFDLLTATQTFPLISPANALLLQSSPVITGFTPVSGKTGSIVTITGTDFDSVVLTNNIVSFNGVNATVQSVNPTGTQLTAIVPAGAKTGPISITTFTPNPLIVKVINANKLGTTTSAGVFTVTSSPTITGFTPASGAVGSTVTITGSNFDTIAANNVVTFNGTPAVVLSVNPTGSQILTTVPAGATTGLIGIANASGVAVSTNVFTVNPLDYLRFTPGNTWTYNISNTGGVYPSYTDPITGVVIPAAPTPPRNYLATMTITNATTLSETFVPATIPPAIIVTFVRNAVGTTITSVQDANGISTRNELLLPASFSIGTTWTNTSLTTNGGVVQTTTNKVTSIVAGTVGGMTDIVTISFSRTWTDLTGLTHIVNGMRYLSRTTGNSYNETSTDSLTGETTNSVLQPGYIAN